MANSDEADKIREFFDLPAVETEPAFSGGDIRRPLSGKGIAGDDILAAEDEDGVMWIRTSGGDARMPAKNFL